MGLIFLAIFLALATTNLAPSLPQQQNQPLQASAQKDCSYNVEPQNPWVVTKKADNIPPEYDFFNGKKWILVKSDVNIPAYKVIGGARFNNVKREMDKVGLVENSSDSEEINKAFFINLGHCNPIDYFPNMDGLCTYTDPLDRSSSSGPTSKDPLSTAAIFVIKQEGVTSYGDALPAPLPILNPPEKTVPQDPNNNFWTFDVYLLESLLQSNATARGVGADSYGNSDVPCWLAQCRGGDLRIGKDQAGIDPKLWNYSCSRLSLSELNGSPVPTPDTSGYSGGLEGSLDPNESFPPSFIRKDWVKITIPTDTVPTAAPAWNEVQDYSWLAGKRTDFPTPAPKFVGVLDDETIKLGTKREIFNVYVDRLAGGSPFADGRLFLEPTINRTGFYYVYLPTSIQSPKEDTLSLQLGTFNPNLGVTYQWWYPSCKPVVYLYPQKETSYNVALRPFGFLTDSIPHYPFFGGWQNVVAQPNGDLSYQGQNYNYLYYEGRSIFVKVPNTGYTVRGYELSDLFDYILPTLGLQGKEINDFKEYWLGRLNEENTYYFISVIPREEIDRVEPMKVDPQPDSLIRVRLFFKKVEEPAISNLPDLGVRPERIGDTVVDWGGFFK